jgi:hypothetical protein
MGTGPRHERLLGVVFASVGNLVDTTQGHSGNRCRPPWRFDALVQFARTHSPFYRDAYRALPARDLSPTELPVMTKQALMARFDDWVTDPR